MASHVKRRSCSLLRGWSIDISALKKTPGKVNWQTPGSFAFKYNGVSHARWIVFYQCTGTRCESHSWYRKLFDWGKKRTRTAQHSRKKRPVKQSEREVFGLHMVCPNSSNVFFLNRIIMPCLFWQFTLHVWVTRCLFQSFIISKLKYLYIVYICADVCREDHVYAYACTAIKHPWVHFFRKETPKKSLPFFILRCLPGSKNRGYPPGIRCRSLVNSDARKKAGWKHHGTWTVLKVLILWPYMLYNYIYIISNEI